MNERTRVDREPASALQPSRASAERPDIHALTRARRAPERLPSKPSLHLGLHERGDALHAAAGDGAVLDHDPLYVDGELHLAASW